MLQVILFLRFIVINHCLPPKKDNISFAQQRIQKTIGGNRITTVNKPPVMCLLKMNVYVPVIKIALGMRDIKKDHRVLYLVLTLMLGMNFASLL